MKIVIAPDSFKGSLSAPEACAAIKEGLIAGSSRLGVKISDDDVVSVPMADGGEGTVECFVTACGGDMVYTEVSGPYGKPLKGYYGLIDNGSTAVVETAAASGITLADAAQKDPLRASTYGTGELIAAALMTGCKRIIVGFGGSATNDGGMGALRALGVEFYDSDGNKLKGCGEDMLRVAHADISGMNPCLNSTELIFACDVTNPFFGENGAAYIFGPQKGADTDTVKLLDKGLRRLAAVYKADMNKDITLIPGAGAAGGLCGGLCAVTKPLVRSGFDVLCEAAGFERLLAAAKLVITGEGRTDAQTMYGKLPYRVGNLAKAYNVPAVCISGSIAKGAEKLCDNGIVALYCTLEAGMSLDYAMKNAYELLASKTASINFGELLYQA